MGGACRAFIDYSGANDTRMQDPLEVLSRLRNGKLKASPIEG